MLQDFARPVGMDAQVAVAVELFDAAYPMAADVCANPQAVERFVRTVGDEIRKVYGRSDFLADRLNRAARREAGLEMGHRAYNKRFRLLGRMEAKLATLTREVQKFEFQMVAKSGLASKLTWEDFAADTDTACFVAYYTARANLRSEFTLDPQQRAFDEIAQMLFRRCERSAAANWWAVAHVYPGREVFAQLDAGQVGALLGRWYGILQEVAGRLGEIWPTLGVDPTGMVVGRGMDSTTWNHTAGAWNKARDNWVGLLYALGLEALLDQVCPGKVMRLMAADLVYLHGAYRSGLDENTEVWAALPLPWEVLAGRATCTRSDVEAACARVGLDPEAKGWTAPRARTRVATFRPTPELVHGVAVTNPHLASVLRRAGWYAGPSKVAGAHA
jgi:hypothetical protein